jgi:enterobactin synthetase component D
MAFAPGDLDAPDPEVALPTTIRASVPKRRIEFLAGRICAREALRAAGETARHDIAIGFLRAPVWPRGFVGSITRTANLAAVAVALSTDAHAVGIDLEPIMSADVQESVGAGVGQPGELRLVTAAGLAPRVALTVLFSAKEALYKCLVPLVGQIFDFLDAEVASVGSQSLSLRLRRRLGAGFREGQVFRASYAIFDDMVIAGVFLGPSGARVPSSAGSARR